MATSVSTPLTTDDLKQRPQYSISMEADNCPRIVVRCFDGVTLSVTGADNLWRLVVAGNAALPNSDPRKITRADEEFLKSLAERIDSGRLAAADMLPLAEALCEKVRAIVLRR